VAYVIAAYAVVVVAVGAYGLALARERRRLERALGGRKMPVDSRTRRDV
jgi:CcmD family protein